MSEPFLLLGEIENHVRRIIANKYPLEILKGVRDPADQSRPIQAVSDLTFGEYIRLLENQRSSPIENVVSQKPGQQFTSGKMLTLHKPKKCFR